MPVGLCVVLPPATLPVGRPLAVGAVTQSVATFEVVLPAAVLLPMVVVLPQPPTFAAAPVPGRRVLGKPGDVAPMLVDEFTLPLAGLLVLTVLVLVLVDEPLPPFMAEAGDELTPLLSVLEPVVPPAVAAPLLPAVPCAKAPAPANAIATPATTPRMECFM